MTRRECRLAPSRSIPNSLYVAYAIPSIDPNIANSGLYPFDIEQRRWMSSQPLSQFSQYVAFSADGALGLTEIITDLAFIDVRARGVLPFRINIPDLWCPDLAMRQQRMFALIHPSPVTAILAQKPADAEPSAPVVTGRACALRRTSISTIRLPGETHAAHAQLQFTADPAR